VRALVSFSKSVMMSVAASTLGRSHLVFIDPDFIPPTHPTNVACDRLYRGLVFGRLALASHSTHFVIDRIQIWTVGIGHNVGGMKSGVSLLSVLMIYLALWAGALS